MSDEKESRSRFSTRSIVLLLIFGVCAIGYLGTGGLGDGGDDDEGGQNLVGVGVSATTTPRPTSAAVPARIDFEPKVINGGGDDVVTLNFDDPTFIDIDYEGESNFVVTSYGADGRQIDLLVNTIGSYEGRVPLNFYDQASTLEVKSDGLWSMKIDHMQRLDRYNPDSTIQGSGDFLFFLSEGAASLDIDGSQNGGNFIVMSHGSTRSLLVNEIGSYEGTVIAPRGASIVQVQSEGRWVINPNR